MDTGQKLGLMLFYSVMVGYAVLLLSIVAQFFRAAIEKHRRQKWIEPDAQPAYTPAARVAKRGRANAWPQRSAEVNVAMRNDQVNAELAGAPLFSKQAIVLVSIFIALGVTSIVPAQQRPARDVSASDLKQQLIDVEVKETQLRMRLEELDEQLEPESIERELAGIGSVHPEKLREHRRKLLTIERNGLQRRLDLLEEDRARIEAAIADAGTAASLEYAPPSPSPLVVTAPAKPITEMISLRDLRIAELPLQKLYVAVAMLVLLGSGFILLLIVATQKVQRWIVWMKSGSSGFPTNGNRSSYPLTPTEARSLKSTQGVLS